MGRGAGLGLGVIGYIDFNWSKSKRYRASLGVSLIGGKNILIGFLMKSIINGWLNKNKTRDWLKSMQTNYRASLNIKSVLISCILVQRFALLAQTICWQNIAKTSKFEKSIMSFKKYFYFFIKFQFLVLAISLYYLVVA